MKRSRRLFLQSAACLPFLGGLGVSSASADDKSSSVKFRLGLASYTTRKFDRAQTIAMAGRAGLKFLCFKDFHLKLDSTNKECAAAAEECKKAGVTLYGAGNITMKKPEEVENAFRYAKAAGMTTMICVPYPEVLDLVERKVKETGIYIAIHNHGPGDKIYPTPESAYEKIKDRDGRIGLCIDVGHTARIGADVVGSIKAYKDRLFDVHIKDETEATPKGNTCIAGRGVLDIPSYLAALKEIGYDRIVSFEYEADADDPLPGLMESVGYVRGILRMMGGLPVQASDLSEIRKHGGII